MLTHNPVAELSASISPTAMQWYVIAMAILVVGGVILDVIHKKSAKYFFEAGKASRANAKRKVSDGEKITIAVKTVAHDVLASGEFCNLNRRIAHLLTMYGFIIFLITTAVLVFVYPTPATLAPAIVPLLWHLGALMVCIGGYWFWFGIRVDVAAEGNPWYRLVRADLFILSLLATTTFALIWSFLQWVNAGAVATLFFVLFIAASTVLFGTVLWSKFAHMFFKPAAAFQRRVSEAEGSWDNLPPPADAPEQFGLGIKRDPPRHY
ncbi:MAG: adenylyl-sulfate reductase [Gammaproteobacteria bacterium]|nr:adenylyl-sulfate reductase [Gammaproteobacteria bacterium]MBU2478406.1 adenylyl-sulfate reductase [Gammaproteobacteria bacterium]